MSIPSRICAFCGSSVGTRPEYARAAEQLAREMVRRRIDLVFVGGRVELMGVVADTTLAAGSHAIGVIPHALVARSGASLAPGSARTSTRCTSARR